MSIDGTPAPGPRYELEIDQITDWAFLPRGDVTDATSSRHSFGPLTTTRDDHTTTTTTTYVFLFSVSSDDDDDATRPGDAHRAAEHLRKGAASVFAT
jgi:hypothetical protein